jgi:O-antigen/teichoic acid export membrane protein
VRVGFNKFSQLIVSIGINRAISYGVIGRIWGSLAGIITILVIANAFSQEEQGFYYTFSSLLAMQMFFELGLTGVVATFASHEFAKLAWLEKGGVEGEPIALHRFEDLIIKSAKWFGLASIVLIVVLIPVGFLFFSTSVGSRNFTWQLPWVLAVIGTAINMMAVPFFAVILGSGDVTSVNERGMIGGIVGSLLSWAVICFGGGLFAVFAVAAGNIIVSWSYLFKTKPLLLKMAFVGIVNKKSDISKFPSISWVKEIWPLQWRIALTWISGYFIFQLFNPVLFHYHGPVVAGQMGMTMSLCTMLLSISAVWTNAKTPEFGKLIAKRDWGMLDKEFFRVFYQSIAISALGAFLAWISIWHLQANYEIGKRFLSASESGLLLTTTVVLIVCNAFALYLRSHKQEPLMTATIITAVFQIASALILGKLYSSIGMIVGYLLTILLFSLPVIYLTWVKCRKKWHKD